MNVAIPSDDLMHIADNFNQAGKLVIFTTEKDKITNEQCIDIKTCSDSNRILSCFKDYSISAAILIKPDVDVELLLSKNQIEMVVTNEILITNAITEYIKEQNLKESNYCCCP